MSAQTGISPPSGPVSHRMVDRARFRVNRLRTEPNPVWIRELKQAARLGRTPVLLAVLTIVFTLLIAAIGGVSATQYSPATTGVVLFHTFFSAAWFVVTLAGPAVAANSIASEREGHTWEALILTGLPPQRIARGKFLAAFTAIGAYVVMLAPVGAISFLFGGVTATEVIVAFAFLFLIALLSVAFGLALSSKMDRLRTAIVVTLLLSFPASSFVFGVLGFGFSAAVHQVWPGVIEYGPVWLPTAYDRADFGLLYVVCLVVLPIVLVTLPAWFLYEVTIANLTSVTDDRSSGIKRWFLVATPVTAIVCGVPPFIAGVGDRFGFAVSGISLLAMFLTFAAFLFQGDPIGPSRRVVVQWNERRASALRRFLGPGVGRAGVLVLLTGVFALVAIVCGDAIALAARASERDATLVFGGYALAFFIFTAGFASFARSRARTAAMARLVLAAVLFAATAGPWIIAAIFGVASSSSDSILMAAPSPFFAIYMMDAVKRHAHETALPVGGACAAVWAVVGLALLGSAARHASKIIRQHEGMLAETDRILQAEDESNAESNAAESKIAEPEPVAVPAPAPVASDIEEPAPNTSPSGGLS